MFVIFASGIGPERSDNHDIFSHTQDITSVISFFIFNKRVQMSSRGLKCFGNCAPTGTCVLIRRDSKSLSSPSPSALHFRGTTRHLFGMIVSVQDSNREYWKNKSDVGAFSYAIVFREIFKSLKIRNFELFGFASIAVCQFEALNSFA